MNDDGLDETICKRVKLTKESAIEDIACTISNIADTVESISNSYRSLLKVNKAVVMYCLEAQKRAKKSSMEEIESSLQQTMLERPK